MKEKLPHIEDPEGKVKNPEVARELADIEDKGHSQRPSRIGRKIEEFLPSGRRKLSEAQEASGERAEHLERQYETGEKIFNELKRIAETNTEYNIHSGKHVETEGPIRISRIERNGDSYSIFVRCQSKTSTEGYWPIVQVDVNLDNKGKEIHIFKGAYGEDEYNDLSEGFDRAIHNARRAVADWKLYKE